MIIILEIPKEWMARRKKFFFKKSCERKRKKENPS